MYCIECGKQIPNNSKFCSHCGHPQNEGKSSVKEKIADKITENEIVRQAIDEQKQSGAYQFLRKAMGWYLAWILIHLGILLIFADSILPDKRNSCFFPDCTAEDYDIREFLVYTIFPLAILIIWSMVNQPNSDKSAEETTN